MWLEALPLTLATLHHYNLSLSVLSRSHTAEEILVDAHTLILLDLLQPKIQWEALIRRPVRLIERHIQLVIEIVWSTSAIILVYMLYLIVFGKPAAFNEVALVSMHLILLLAVTTTLCNASPTVVMIVAA